MLERFESTYTGEDQSALEQFLRLSEILGGELVFPVLHAAPDRPRAGRVVASDGIDWDPIAAGVPRLVWYNGTAWKALDA